LSIARLCISIHTETWINLFYLVFAWYLLNSLNVPGEEKYIHGQNQGNSKVLHRLTILRCWFLWNRHRPAALFGRISGQ